jgi:PPOX class probable F420-dependent enzyme
MPQLTASTARIRFASARVARLATADDHGQPHLVPIVFAVAGDTIYSAVDAKPKQTNALRRLANVRLNPQVTLLVDRYDDDWSALWWVRADGSARILDFGEAEAAAALALLADKYLQYREQHPPGPVIAVDVSRWVSWSATPEPEVR